MLSFAWARPCWILTFVLPVVIRRCAISRLAAAGMDTKDCSHRMDKQSCEKIGCYWGGGEPCTLCWAGQSPASHTFKMGSDDSLSCGEASDAVETIFTRGDGLCEQFNTMGYVDCGCPEPPSYRDPPACSLCSDGFPSKPNEVLDLGLDWEYVP